MISNSISIRSNNFKNIQKIIESLRLLTNPIDFCRTIDYNLRYTQANKLNAKTTI